MPQLVAGGGGIGGGAIGLSIGSAFDSEGDVPNDFTVPSPGPNSVKRGEKYFKKLCAQCHSIYPDNRVTRSGQTQLGPTMFNIYGRASGIADIQNKQASERVDNVLWTAGPLMNYMRNPRRMAQGIVQMNFFGIKDVGIRVDIIHYLMTLDWSNEKIANPPVKPSSFPPNRWLQQMASTQASAA